MQAGVARQHTVEDQIERLRPDTRTGDAAHVHLRRAEPVQVLPFFKQALESAGPRGVLVEKKPFRLTSAAHEHPIQSVLGARYFVASLSVAVDFEPDFRLEPGEGREHAKAHARGKDVIEAPIADPPARGELGRRSEQQHRANADYPD